MKEIYIELIEKAVGIILVRGSYTDKFAQELRRRKDPLASISSSSKSNRSFFDISRKVKSHKRQATVTEID